MSRIKNGCRGMIAMIDELLKRIEQLEYHQELLTDFIDEADYPFTRLIIRKNLSREEVIQFYDLCDQINKKLQEQKAEGLVYFHPLLKEFSKKLNKKLDVEETIEACIKQNLYIELMEELKKYI